MCRIHIKITAVGGLIAMGLPLMASALEPGSEAQFRGIDRNADQKIDADEARAYRSRLMTTFDANGDGSITVEEWIEVRKLRSSVNPEQKVDTPDDFRAIDLNSDSVISTEEMQQFGEARFAALDEDNDGIVSADEFRRDGL